MKEHCDHVVKNRIIVLRALYLKALNGKGTQKDYQEFINDLETISDCYLCVSSRFQCPLSRFFLLIGRIFKNEKC